MSLVRATITHSFTVGFSSLQNSSIPDTTFFITPSQFQAVPTNDEKTLRLQMLMFCKNIPVSRVMQLNSQSPKTFVLNLVASRILFNSAEPTLIESTSFLLFFFHI